LPPQAKVFFTKPRAFGQRNPELRLQVIPTEHPDPPRGAAFELVRTQKIVKVS
jgi:hypothetical protein